MKKIISILVIVAMMLASVLAIIPVAAADPEGSAITNADDFAAMEAEGKYYLANDITLSASYAEFKGTLDGNGKTITMNGAIPAFKKLVGATVKNLNIVSKFEATVSGDFGALANSASGTFDNIHADVEMEFTAPITNNVGGIFGLVNGTTMITNSSTKGFIHCPVKADHSAGDTGRGQAGLVGRVDGGTFTVTNCVNYAEMNAHIIRGSSAGIAGFINVANATITNCVNYGYIENISGGLGGNVHCGAGGIVGMFDAHSNLNPVLTITACRNYGEVYAKMIIKENAHDCMVGGILGRAYGVNVMTIQDCVNSGYIHHDKNDGNWASAGGIMGNSETYNYNWSTNYLSDVQIKNCINLGDVEGGNYTAGVLGSYLQGNAPDLKVTITDCANYGDVIGGNYAAAAFGRAGDGGTVALTVTNFYNCGKVTGKSNAGFLVGNVSSGWDVTNATKKDVLQDADGNNVPFPTCAFTNCINDGEIGGGVILGVINNPVTLKDCASTFEGDAYQNAPNVTIISEVSDVAAAKAALLALLPADVTELTELVIESEDMFADDYKSGWDAYEAAISDAKAAINQAISVETATEVLEAVKTAKAALVPIDSVNFDALNDAIAEADTLVNTDDKVYTPATWAAFDAARAAAKEVAGATKQSTVNKALNALVAAMDALEKIPDIAALNAAIATAEALTEADYVTATWAALAEVVAKAKVLAADENATNSQVEAIMADMAAATAALDKKVDTTPLATKVTETEKAYPRDTYTAMSYGKLTTAIREAQTAAASNDIGQATLNALSKAIDDAVAGLAKRATFADIDALLATTEALVETDFTPDSWKVYEEALEEVNNAKKEDKKPNVSVDDEAKLLEKLTAAVNGLVPYATYDALNARVKEVNAMDKAKYTVESWAAVEAAIAKVDELKSNRYATQPEADAILEEINAAVDALVEATAGGDNTTAETQAPTTGGNTTDDTKEGGCGGFIATTAVVMASVLALGAAVVAKKKED